MSTDDMLGIIRHLLTTAGGGLVANGVVTGAQEQDAVGAIVVLIGVVWSLIQKRQQRAAVAVALATPIPWRSGLNS